jgi:BirA family biotin operon repressor/biotin-[acetyl-CoA-carboxylase] ligase
VGEHPAGDIGASGDSLTLALGIGVADVLERCGVDGVMLKWPNDLMAGDAKLGGILAEAQYPRRGEAVIVAGIGLNVNLPEELGGTASPAYASAIDLHSLLAEPPSRETLAVALILGWRRIFREFETAGFEAFEERYARLDWLEGRRIVVATAEKRVEGLAAGVNGTGALLIETQSGVVPVVSGSILAVEGR